MYFKPKEYPLDIVVENHKGSRICNKCKIEYTLSPSDISTKNPNVYYKCCKPCRDYCKEMVKKFYEKTGKTHKSYLYSC